MSNLNVDTVTAANVQATGMVSANTALKAPNYADAGKPASADPGVIIYNTTGQDVELWKGSSWLSLGAGNMRTWSGEEGRPTSPSTGQFGFNITTGQAEIFNGSDWVTFGSNAAEGASGLFEFSSFTFLSIVSRGSRNGPNSSQMSSAYSGETWNDGTNFKQGDYQGYQVWTVPEDGTYTIEAGGAKGGRDLNYGQTNLWGAKISGQFTLTKGTELSMVVGVGGGQYYSPHGNEAGGGGGSFVVNKSASSPLLIAGGGGGSASNTHGWSCGRSTSTGQGQSGEYGGRYGCYYDPSQPTAGYGGNTQGNYHGGGGGGYYTGGQTGGGHCCTAYGGQGYNNGMVGGTGNCCYGSSGSGEGYNYGGFGGGGGGQLSGPGAGGGWTGGCTAGQWSGGSTHGGGGGSYNQGSSTNNQAGGNSGSDGGTYAGAGYIKITKQ